MNINKFAMLFPTNKMCSKFHPEAPFVPRFCGHLPPTVKTSPAADASQVASLTVVTWMLRCLELVSEAEIAWFGLKSK